MNRLHIDSAPETNCLHSPMTLTFRGGEERRGGAARLATRSASMSFQLELLTEKYPGLSALSGVEPRCRKRVINNLLPFPSPSSLPRPFLTMIRLKFLPPNDL